MFRPEPIVGTLIAEYDGALAGCAVWHRSFSTNRGAEVMYLEDCRYCRNSGGAAWRGRF